MSVYAGDAAEHVTLAIDSIYNQTLPPDEVIIVIDGPVNKSISDAIESRTEAPNVFRIKENGGLAHALNFGLNKCEHEWIARMDADDYALPDRFEKLFHAVALEPELSLLGAQHKVFCSDLKKEEGLRLVPTEHNDIVRYSKYRTPINHPTIIFRKSSILAVGGYPENIGRFEDWGLCLRLIKSGFRLKNISALVLHVRGGNNMMARRRGINYLLEEIRALRALRRNKLISRSMLIKNIAIRAPLRLIPETVLRLVYSQVLRKKSYS